MNYSKFGIKKQIREYRALWPKIFHKLIISAVELGLIAGIGVAVILACFGFGVFKGVLSSAPDISNIDVSPSGFSTFVYDTDGKQTAKLVAANSNRIPVSMDQIPENLAHAFVAIEDERFYEHNGIDIKGIVRAAVIAVRSKDLSQGASTITQQLLKNNVFSGWTSETTTEKIKRKLQEQYLALELEKVMDKDKILENYMNTINLGQSTLGVQAASMRYFNKHVSQLSLSECAVIASITQNPSKYNPISHPELNVERQQKVLGNMLEQGYITKEEYDAAMADDVYSRIQVVNQNSEKESVQTYFIDALTEDVLDDLVNVAGYNETQAYNLLFTGGLSIYSTQDMAIQNICDEVFSNEDNYPAGTQWLLYYELSIRKKDGSIENYSSEKLEAYFKQDNPKFNRMFASKEEAENMIQEFKDSVMSSGDEELGEVINLTPQPQISFVVEDQSTGYIRAMVGGRGSKEASRTLNRATDAKRQPGSTFKVVSTFAPALDSAGYTLANVHVDEPYNYVNGRPVSNWYHSGYRGICSIRDAIRDSLNIITVKTLTDITPQLGYDYLINFGFTTLVNRLERNGQVFSDVQQSLALGGITYGVTNEELNNAYASIANGGTCYKPALYTKIVDHDGKVIIDNTVPSNHRVLKETTSYLLTSAMKDVVTSGTGGSVNFGNMAIAGKTGTTSDYNDVWFAGYTPYYTATCWTGYDNNVKLTGDGKNLAKKMWRACMSRIHENLEYKDFEKPPGIVSATVCSQSGKKPIAGLCDGCLKTEIFDQDVMPSASCDVHVATMKCAYTGLVACDECPFKTPGVATMKPGGGSNLIVPDENGETTPEASGEKCMHNAEFMANPAAPAVIEQQLQEMQAAAAAAAQPAEAAPAEEAPAPAE